MINFISEKISEHVIRIHGLMDEQMYLVEGREKAALIDTGTGVGSLRTYVRTLTDKPIVVLLTHGHLDHAMGSVEFDTVYMNRRDDYIYEQHRNVECRKLFLSESPRFHEILEEDYLSTVSCNYFKNFDDSAVFDLGGVSIEAFSCSGHTMGSMVFLLREERTLITGDACNTFTFLYGNYSTGLSTYEKSLQTLKVKVQGRYDRIYLSHGVSDAGKELLEEVLEVCKDIKQHRTEDIPYSHHTDMNGNHGLIAKAINADMRRADGKFGNIVYNPDRIWE